VTQLEGLESSNAKFPYSTRWENNLDNPRSKKFTLIPHERNKVLLIKNDGLVSPPEDTIKYQRVRLESEYTEYEGKVQIGAKVMVSSRMIADLKMERETIKNYILSSDENGDWMQFKENQ
jgi:hypothetical protein